MLAALLVVAGCDSPVTYENWWLDSPEVHDPSIDDPSYRVSTRPGMTEADRSRPVIIAVHGFTASTFEWHEFREYAEAESDVLVSLVLLGGHGRTLDEFEVSTWETWGEPIVQEYDGLVAQGYTNINLVGSSTGGTLILDHIAAGRYSAPSPPRNFFFIDPIVVPGDKTLSLIPLLRHLVTNVVQEGTVEEAPHWYSNRPTAALAQLNKLINRVRSQLAGGVSLPAGARAKVYKTTADETADPVSALLIYKGLREAGGERIDVEMLESNLHVFTRLQARNSALVTQADRQRQRDAFDEMIERVSN